MEKILYPIKTIFLMLFFTRVILLTPEPITLTDEWTYIVPEKPIAAITGGATIRIDVSKYINNKNSFNEVDDKFPNGTIKGKLITENGTIIEIENRSSSHGQTEVHLMLGANEPIPTDIKFIKVALKSSQIIKDVDVYWKNFSM